MAVEKVTEIGGDFTNYEVLSVIFPQQIDRVPTLGTCSRVWKVVKVSEAVA